MSVIEWVDQLRRTTSYVTTDIKTPTITPTITPTEPTPEDPSTKKEEPSGEATIRLDYNRIVDLEDKDVGRQVRNLIGNFHEAVKGTRASSINPD